MIAVPVSIVAYYATLHWIYQDFILQPFKYAGFTYTEPTLANEIVVILICIIVTLTLPSRITRPSAVVLWVLFVVVIAPSILMGPYLGIGDQGGVISMGLGVGAAFAVASLASRASLPSRRFRFTFPAAVFWISVGAFSAFVYIYTAAVAGVHLRLPALSDVYDVRSDYSDALLDSRLLGYLLSTQANAVNPIIIAAGLYSRRILPLSLGILGQVFLFSTTGFKTILFSIPAILVIAILFRFNRRPGALKLILGGCGVLVLASLADYVQGGILWSSLLARRFLITPARLTGVYFDYYGSHPYHLLGNAALSPWVESPYRYGPPRNISLFLTGSPNTAMNANMFADGFAQFGWLGVALITLLLALYLRTLDQVSKGLPAAVTSLVVVMPAVTLSNTSIFTSLLSHGLLAALILLSVAPRNIWGMRAVASRGIPRSIKAPSSSQPPVSGACGST